MTLQAFLFYLLATIAIGSALCMVTLRNMARSLFLFFCGAFCRSWTVYFCVSRLHRHNPNHGLRGGRARPPSVRVYAVQQDAPQRAKRGYAALCLPVCFARRINQRNIPNIDDLRSY